MKNIFVPVDFSEESLGLCEFAIQMAADAETNIQIAHVYADQLMVPDSSIPGGIDNDAFLNTEFIESLKEQSTAKMAALVEQLRSLHGSRQIHIDSFVVGGDPDWKIQELCEELRPDMVVMGTKSKANSGIFQGSTAKRIMNHLQLPVIVVPEGPRSFRLKNIMYACEQCDQDFGKIKLLFKFFEHFEVKLFVVHLILDKKKKKEDGFYVYLKKLFEQDQNQGRIFFHLIDTTDKEIALQTFTDVNEIDMIAFIARKTNIFTKLFTPKIFKEDLFKLGIPMIALHST